MGTLKKALHPMSLFAGMTGGSAGCVLRNRFNPLVGHFAAEALSLRIPRYRDEACPPQAGNLILRVGFPARSLGLLRSACNDHWSP